MARQTVKARTAGRLAATVQQAVEAGEQVRASVPAITMPPPALAVGVPLLLLAGMVIVLTTLPLGALGDLVVTVVFVGLMGAFNAAVTKRYALALTDRQLVWVPWNGKTATGPAEAEGHNSVRVIAMKAGRMRTALTFRLRDGTERRAAIPRDWQSEARFIAEGLGFSA